MSNSKPIAAALRIVESLQEGPPDPRSRLADIQRISAETLELQQMTAAVYSSVMREYVAEVGATAAARELGISRNRVYEVMKHEG
ncbi:hypothetical protein [Aeromicrobium sp. UC242_57]|uniref:hypothetical protein n=1 Tax=Aeromicrobium sp. UC242_57 TaxID=3374624 RepID=UPI0037A6E2A4